jgi:hypothetical protein
MQYFGSYRVRKRSFPSVILLALGFVLQDERLNFYGWSDVQYVTADVLLVTQKGKTDTSKKTENMNTCIRAASKGLSTHLCCSSFQPANITSKCSFVFNFGFEVIF